MSLGRSLGMKGLNGSLVMFSAVSGVSVSISSVQFSSVAQSCPTLHDPMDCSPPASSVHGIFQARLLE